MGWSETYDGVGPREEHPQSENSQQWTSDDTEDAQSSFQNVVKAHGNEDQTEADDTEDDGQNFGNFSGFNVVHVGQTEGPDEILQANGCQWVQSARHRTAQHCQLVDYVLIGEFISYLNAPLKIPATKNPGTPSIPRIMSNTKKGNSWSAFLMVWKFEMNIIEHV